MTKELTNAELAQALLGISNQQAVAPGGVMRSALPSGVERDTTKVPEGTTVLEGFDGEAVRAHALGFAAARRAALKVEEVVEEVEQPAKEPTVRELLAAATEIGARAQQTFDRIARSQPPRSAPPPAVTSDRNALLDRAVETEAARRAEKKRVKLGRRLDKIVGRYTR